MFANKNDCLNIAFILNDLIMLFETDYYIHKNCLLKPWETEEHIGLNWSMYVIHVDSLDDLPSTIVVKICEGGNCVSYISENTEYTIFYKCISLQD